MEPNVIMKACPCYEVFYCSKACQNDDWKQHKAICTYRMRKKQGSTQKLPMEDEALFLMKHHDVDLVEMAVAAMGPDVDLSIETERLAAVFFLAARSPDSKLPNPIGGWRLDLVQPFDIEKVVVGPVEEQAQRFGLNRDFLEFPIQRIKRLFYGSHAMLNVSIVFEPTGKFITKNVPRIQLTVWKMSQEREKKTTNPPRLNYLRHVTNGRINYGLLREHERRPPDADDLRKLEDIPETDDSTSTVSPKLQRSISSMSSTTKESTSAVTEPCLVCGTLSTMRCSLCHKAHYCSPEHIQSDWPSHKINCYVRPPKDARGDPEGAFEISGILFPEDEDTPRIIKVKCLGGYTLKGQWWQTKNLKPYIPDDEKKGRGHVIMDGALVPGEDSISYGCTSEIFFRKNFLHDGSKINRCIQYMTNGQMAVPWAGPFIAFRYSDALWSYDAVMNQDMSVLIQYFRTGITGPVTALAEAQREARKDARKEARRAWRSQ